MRTTFKPGDKVVCVDNSRTERTGSISLLRIYEIEEIRNNCNKTSQDDSGLRVKLKGIENLYYPYRFILLTEQKETLQQ